MNRKPDPTQQESLKILTREMARTKAQRHAHREANLIHDSRQYTYGDQKGQVDYFINHVMDYQNRGLPRGGFFIDLACADGIEINNTRFLEKWLGWSGLLFEANPGYHDNIREHRTSPLITDCVYGASGDTVRFRIDNGLLGGIVSEDTDNNPTIRAAELKNAEIIDIPTISLMDALARHDAPEVIDFFSLDVEGAEYLILKDFDFARYKFRCLAIERPNEDLDMLLDAQGYRQVRHLTFDVIYVHKDYLAEVNFDPQIFFSFTPRKAW